MNPDFWRGKKVMVTGHTGFKGSWLCLWLQHLGAEVTGYALDPPTEPSLFEQADVGGVIRSVHGDIRDLEHLQKVTADFSPGIIFHLAAQSVVKESYVDPVETYSTNVVGTACLFQALRSIPGPRTVVNVTTDKCYKNREWIWGYRETDELGGHDPYSNSKACAELVTQSFRDSFFPVAEYSRHQTGIATARAGNVIGGGDWTANQLVPDIIRAIQAGNPVKIRQPDSTRPWQHVLDCLGGYLLLAQQLNGNGPQFSEAWNFGPELADTKPVSWIAERTTSVWGDGARWIIDPGKHAYESMMLRLDNSKATEVLGWEPGLRLAKALDWTVHWYKSYLDGHSARELCLQQIEEFMAINKRD